MLSFTPKDRAQLAALSLDTIAQKIPLQPLIWPEIAQAKLKLYLRRDDLISPSYSGNKFYKLYHNVIDAIESQKSTILTFGGAYSNHIHALAALGHELGLKTIGVIRGTRPENLSPTLQDASAWGMELIFVSKIQYRHKDLASIEALAPLLAADDVFVIPEGGANIAGIEGCRAIAKAVSASLPADTAYYLCSATATGTTLAGLVAATPAQATNIGFSVLKGPDTITDTVNRHLQSLGLESSNQFTIETDYHFGGYAKITPELIDFIKRFEGHNDLKLDPVYTGKMLYGIEQLALNGHWPEGSTVVAIHSGGLQGRRGYPQL